MDGMEVGLAGLRAARHLFELPAHSMGVCVFHFAGVMSNYILGVQTNWQLEAVLYWETDTRQSFIEVLPSRELTTGM